VDNFLSFEKVQGVENLHREYSDNVFGESLEVTGCKELIQITVEELKDDALK